MIQFTLSLLLAAMLLLGASAANAGGCGPFANTLYVGNTAIDNECDYDTIQAAIDAVTTCPTTIVITTQRTWSGQHLNITDKALTLSGGDGNCGSVLDPGLAAPTMTTGTPPPDRVSLTGHDGVDDSIVEITGNSHVKLRNLVLSGAGDVETSSQNGGGVRFDGQGSLTLENVAIHGNHAGMGGGIYMRGQSGHAELQLRAHTTIHDNTAQFYGGGVAMLNDARLLMVEAQTSIAYNEARGLDDIGNPSGGDGGGIFVDGAKVDIGSPGYTPGLHGNQHDAAIANNSAIRGGGIWVQSMPDSEGLLRVFAKDEHVDTGLVANTANWGGALGLSGATACLFGVNIMSNTAFDGAFATARMDSELYLNVDPTGVCDTTSLPEPGVVHGFGSVDIGSNDGAIVIGVYDSTLQAERIIMAVNTADSAIRAISSTVSLSNCLLARNGIFLRTLWMQASPLSIDHCTLADNGLVGDGLGFDGVEIETDSDFNLTRSILYEPLETEVLRVTSSSAQIEVRYVITNFNNFGLPSGLGVLVGDPSFLFPQLLQYNLTASSIAIDFAPGCDGKDLDFRPRKVDLPTVDNEFGACDLGPYEYQLPGSTPDSLFHGGFEVVLLPSLQ